MKMTSWKWTTLIGEPGSRAMGYMIETQDTDTKSIGKICEAMQSL